MLQFQVLLLRLELRQNYSGLTSIENVLLQQKLRQFSVVTALFDLVLRRTEEELIGMSRFDTQVFAALLTEEQIFLSHLA